MARMASSPQSWSANPDRRPAAPGPPMHPLIGAVHVAAWRSAYPGILPENYLARLSVTRQAAHYDRLIRAGEGVYVAIASGRDVPGASSGPRLGRLHNGRPPRAHSAPRRLSQRRRDRDALRARRLARMRGRSPADPARAPHTSPPPGRARRFCGCSRAIQADGSTSASAARPVAAATTNVAGVAVPQTAYTWDPIERLIASSPAP